MARSIGTALQSSWPAHLGAQRRHSRTCCANGPASCLAAGEADHAWKWRKRRRLGCLHTKCVDPQHTSRARSIERGRSRQQARFKAMPRPSASPMRDFWSAICHGGPSQTQPVPELDSKTTSTSSTSILSMGSNDIAQRLGTVVAEVRRGVGDCGQTRSSTRTSNRWSPTSRRSEKDSFSLSRARSRWYSARNQTASPETTT